MDQLKICVAGDPKPLSRPRFSGRRAYLPQRDRDYRQQIQSVARAAMNGQEPMTGELSCRMKFYRKYRRTTRQFGDLDNHVKAILDALNGVAFADDSAVVEVTAIKFTDRENPRVEIELTESLTFTNQSESD